MVQGIRNSWRKCHTPSNLKGACLRGGTRYGRLPDASGGIQAATFGNCLIVEPQRQGYTQDFRFKIDQALRGKGLQKTDLIEWHHGGIGHLADGSLLLNTGFIKPPPRTIGEFGDTNTARTTHLAQQRSYRVCGRCHKPEARLKCTCLSVYYCGAKCQREDLPNHRKVCTDTILKDLELPSPSTEKSLTDELNSIHTTRA